MLLELLNEQQDKQHKLHDPSLQVLLASNELGCEVSLLHATPDEVAPLQSLRLTGPSAASLFNRVTVDPVASVVLLGSNKQCLYALHTSGMQSDMRFDYVTEFRMAFPILSMAAVGGEQVCVECVIGVCWGVCCGCFSYICALFRSKHCPASNALVAHPSCRRKSRFTASKPTASTDS